MTLSFLGLMMISTHTNVVDTHQVIFHEDRLPKVSVSRNCESVLIGRRGRVRAFMLDGKYLNELSRDVTAFAFAPDSQKVALGYADGWVRIHEFPNWSEHSVSWRPHAGAIEDVVWLSDCRIGTASHSGLQAPSASSNQTVDAGFGSFCIADDLGTVVCSLSMIQCDHVQVAGPNILCKRGGDEFSILNFSDDRLRVVANKRDGRAVLCNDRIVVLNDDVLKILTHTLEAVAEFRLTKAYNQIEPLPNDRVGLSRLSFYEDTVTDVISLADGKIIWSPTTPGCLTALPDGRALFHSEFKTTTVLEVAGKSWEQPKPQTGEIKSIASLSKSLSLVGGADGGLLVLDHNRMTLRPLAHHAGLWDCVATDRFVLSTGRGLLAIRDRSGRLIKRIEIGMGWAIDAAGGFGAVLCDDGVLVVDLNSLEIRNLVNDEAESIALSPSGKLLAIGNEFEIQVFETKSLDEHSVFDAEETVDAQHMQWLTENKLVIAGEGMTSHSSVRFLKRKGRRWTETKEIDVTEVTALAADGESILVGCDQDVLRIDMHGNSVPLNVNARARVSAILRTEQGTVLSGSIAELRATRADKE
jgi:hypothetical protein